MKKNGKKLTSLLMIISMLFSMIILPPTAVSAEQLQAKDHDLYLLENVSQKTSVPSGFTGIYSEEDLLSIVKGDRTANYILMKDLDLSGLDWVPLKFPSQWDYAGTFDGNGHTINISHGETEESTALFYGNEGTIKNLRLTGTINVYHEYLGNRQAASVALENVGTIRNCTSSVDYVSSGGSPVLMAGIVATNGGTVSHCRYTGSMKSSARGDANFGGIAYYNNYHYNDYNNRYDRIGKIEYCESNSRMTVLMGGEEDIVAFVNGGEVIIGGIVGEAQMETSVEVCRFTGSVYVAGTIGGTFGASFSVGGICGEGDVNQTYSDCCFTGKIRFNCTAEDSQIFNTGGIAGKGCNDMVKNCFVAGEILDEGTLLGAPGWFFGQDSSFGTEEKSSNNYYPSGSLDLCGSGEPNEGDSGYSAVPLASMARQTTFAGFDFGSTWTMGQSYPVQKVFTNLYGESGMPAPEPVPDPEPAEISADEYVLQHLVFLDSSQYKTRSQLRFSTLMEECMDNPDQNTSEWAYKILNTINEATKFKKWSVFDNQYEAVLAELITGAAMEETDSIDLAIESQSLTIANNLWKMLKNAYPGKYTEATYETSLQKLLKDPQGLEEENPGIYRELKGALDDYFMHGQDKADAIRAISGTTALYGKMNDFITFWNDCNSVVEWVSELHDFQCTVEALYSLSQEQLDIFRSLDGYIQESAGAKEALLYKTAYQKFDNYLTREHIAAAVFEEGVTSFGELTMEILNPLINTVMTNYLVDVMGLSSEAAGDIMILLAGYHVGWALGTTLTNNDQIMANCDLLHANAKIEEALYEVMVEKAGSLKTERSYSAAKDFDAAWMLLRTSEKYAVSVYKNILTAMQDSMKSKFLTLGRVDIYGTSKADEITLANYEYIKWDTAICHGQKMHDAISGSNSNINTVNLSGVGDFSIMDDSGQVLGDVYDGEISLYTPSILITKTGNGYSVTVGGDLDLILDLYGSEDGAAARVEVITVNENGREISRSAEEEIDLSEEVLLEIRQEGNRTPTIETYEGDDGEEFVRIDPESCSVMAGDTFSFDVTLDPSIAKEKVYWWSDDPDIVEIDQTGRIKALRAGRTYINARAGGDEYQDYSDIWVLFRDVADEGSYFFSPVYWALEEGVTTGTSATHFSPNAQCQRYQFVLFLWRMAGEPEPESGVCPFSDVKQSDLFYDAVLWAYENGITNGSDATHFSPYKDLSRAQVCTFLYRSAGSPSVSDGNPFADIPSGEYYTDAVRWASREGVTNGTDSTHFSPYGICTRAQTVTFLYRMTE